MRPKTRQNARFERVNAPKRAFWRAKTWQDPVQEAIWISRERYGSQGSFKISKDSAELSWEYIFRWRVSHVEELTTDGFLNLYVFAGYILCCLDILLHEHLQKLLQC